MASSRGRHRRPSKTSKVVARTTTTTGAFMVASAAIASPHHAQPVIPAHLTVKLVKSQPIVTADLTSVTNYTVESGNSLSGIAKNECGSVSDWSGIYDANKSKIGPDPNLIEPGQELVLDCGTGHVTTASKVVEAATPTSSGDYSCSGLESLWEAAGGQSGEAFIAAEIAMAESGGNPNALSPTDDIGLWQINAPSWGSMASYNPSVNAESAVKISNDGTNWDPWTTYTSGAYEGKC